MGGNLDMQIHICSMHSLEMNMYIVLSIMTDDNEVSCFPLTEDCPRAESYVEAYCSPYSILHLDRSLEKNTLIS